MIYSTTHTVFPQGGEAAAVVQCHDKVVTPRSVRKGGGPDGEDSFDAEDPIATGEMIPSSVLTQIHYLKSLRQTKNS